MSLPSAGNRLDVSDAKTGRLKRKKGKKVSELTLERERENCETEKLTCQRSPVQRAAFSARVHVASSALACRDEGTRGETVRRGQNKREKHDETRQPSGGGEKKRTLLTATVQSPVALVAGVG